LLIIEESKSKSFKKIFHNRVFSHSLEKSFSYIMIFSGIPHTTASLFHMRDFVKEYDKVLLYVDSEEVSKELENI
jgi:hypothetical protein